MKEGCWRMKKVLLFSVFLLVTLSAMAYETIIIKFPDKELWVKAYYKKIGTEAILQYVPNGQSSNNWTRTIVVHSYNGSTYPINIFLSNNLARMRKINPTGSYKTLRLTPNDAIAGRCTEAYGKVEAQCEFLRVTRGYEGIVTIHYMNKNKDDFMENYSQWYNIIKKARLYNSYYRDERTLDKAEYFEL